jgi:hypothetical protein
MRTIFFIFIMFSASLAIAQTSFAILGGVNFQNLNGKDYFGDKLTNEMIVGFHAGVNAQVPVAPTFYFQPGLLFSTKGATNTETFITNTYKLSYIELPLNFVYKGAIGNGFILIGFGPYLAYGIAGKAIYQEDGNKIESDIEFKNEIDASDPLTTTYLKPFDAGGNIFVGYETASGIFTQLNTQFGMININPTDNRFPEGKTAVKNTGFGLSVGYRF